jgi:hypothetical protein
MKALPTNGMPFDVHEQIQHAKYGHPVTYPNSENIAPPLEKERLRVVEQATRTEIKMNRQRVIEERIKEINELRQQAALRYNRDGSSVSPGEIQGQFIDVEV